MKEVRKIIPFVIAACIAATLFTFNPSQEAHVAKIKAEYIETSPKTWRATWWNYERSLEYRGYLFFSVVNRKNRPRSIGIAGAVATVEER